MCDGNEELVFAIDCGAHYPFSISDGGEREFVTLHADGDDIQPCFAYGYPYERWAGDVVAHLDSPGSGWIGRTAEVSVDGLDDSHFFPNGSETVTAVVTNCHEDAYIGCTWSGGEGISFSNNHSLTTTINWNSTNGMSWATNYVDLVTTYEGGYAVTNHHGITVGPLAEPTTAFLLGCQKVFFLNDADFLEPGECPTNRPERIRPVTLRLVATCGTGGYVSITNTGATCAVLFHIENGVTNRIDSSTRIRLEVPEGSFTRESVKTVYMSCPELGRGTIRATWVPDEGENLVDESDYQVIEPIRRLVNNEPYDGTSLIVNPFRLVCGTNTVFAVGVSLASGDTFDATNMTWNVVSGQVHKVSEVAHDNRWYITVEPTTSSGEVVIEAKFNDDEIQPRFVLPLVQPRSLNVRVCVVEPEIGSFENDWYDTDIQTRILEVNRIFSQIGLSINVIATVHRFGTPNDWWIPKFYDVVKDEHGRESYVQTDQITRMFLGLQDDSAVNIVFTGYVKDGRAAGVCYNGNVFLSRESKIESLAHELGHALGWQDCYSRKVAGNRRWQGVRQVIEHGDEPVWRGAFSQTGNDWGQESGRGFYRLEDTLRSSLEKLLMHGIETGGVDIPDSSVLSLRRYATSSTNVFFSAVGAVSIKTNQTQIVEERK